jgi:hypothetical protein
MTKTLGTHVSVEIGQPAEVGPEMRYRTWWLGHSLRRDVRRLRSLLEAA